MPWYRLHGKILQPLTDEQFVEGMKGHFVERKHKGFVALLYYSGVRKREVLRATREQFHVEGDELIFDVGKRLKHGPETPPLNIPLEAPYVNEVLWAVKHTDGPKQRVWPYSDKTGYNIVRRVFKYPHLFRLSRITSFFMDPEVSIADVHSWTGLSLKALDFYLGLVRVKKMGRKLLPKKTT